MRAAVFEDYGKIVLGEVPEPEPAEGEIKIRVVTTGICGSDIHAFKGTHPFRRPPAILGHEMAGDIVALGPGVENFAVGDRVTINPQRVCGKCGECRSGNPNRCTSKLMLGVPGWSGSFGEYVVSPESVAYKLPDHISYEEGSLVEPLAVGVHAARQATLGPGASVVVLGGGSIGQCTLAAALNMGASQAILTDAFDYNLKAALQLGASKVVNVRTEDVVGSVMEATDGKGADVAFVTVGLSSVFNQAIDAVRQAGEVVVVAHFDEELRVSNPFALVGGERVIRGSQTYNPSDFAEALRLVSSGQVGINRLISHVLPLDQVQKAFGILTNRTEDALKIVMRVSDS